MIHRHIRTIIALLLLTLYGTAYSQDSTYHDNEYFADWYQVEIFIFQHKTKIPNKDQEVWPTNISMSYPPGIQFIETLEQQEQNKTLELAGTQDSQATSTIENNTYKSNAVVAPHLEQSQTPPEQGLEGLDQEIPERELPYKSLTEEHFTFSNNVKAMLRTNKYRLLFYDAWRQPIKAKSETADIFIHGGKQYGKNNELEGTISISVNRYLHLHTDLWLTYFEPSFGSRTFDSNTLEWPLLPTQPKPLAPLKEQDSEITFTLESDQNNTLDWNFESSPKNNPFEKNNPFALDEKAIELQSDQFSNVTDQLYIAKKIVKSVNTRKMRSGELHYIDHPEIGIIIQVDKYSPEIPAETDITVTN